ncbi:unnamed protein product [Pleuronectes platessa]|uniref:Uncharacterized protein n=1 Tax=Pleuronectes platessa TaxID=8262 RepID=A0A9N7ZBI0_PLEPL|nr:unnamed protein product [Pleuronectes platessa]
MAPPGGLLRNEGSRTPCTETLPRRLYLIMFKCVNLYVERTVSRASLPVGDQTQSQSEEENRTVTEDLNNTYDICCSTAKLRARDAVWYTDFHSACGRSLKEPAASLCPRRTSSCRRPESRRSAAQLVFCALKQEALERWNYQVLLGSAPPPGTGHHHRGLGSSDLQRCSS